MNTYIEAQIAALQAELLVTPATSPEYGVLAAQITTLENEVAVNPLVNPIFFPHGGGQHGGGHR